MGADGRGLDREEALSERPAQTIWAPATAPGRAAVGILRISGPDAAEACRRLTGRDPPPPRRATLRRLLDRDGLPVDEGLIVWFPEPASVTGEDVLELHHHGGVAVARALADAVAAVPGLRAARPGELTRRAFMAGKLDLTQAEAIADLVDASTNAQLRQAVRQLDGVLGRHCASWRERLLDALARIEAEIDFAADQDVPDDLHRAILPGLIEVASEIETSLGEASRGERLRAGVTVAVTGAPNVGKSSLVNLLARREVALVTAVAGTTRDVIEVPLDLDGLPVTLLDTAGLRDTDDPVEAVGIALARRRAAQADLRLLLVEAGASAPRAPVDGTIVVHTKIDLVPVSEDLGISCLTGAGIDTLLSHLGERTRALTGDGDATLITAARHREALTIAAAALRRLLQAPAEPALMAEDLRLAARAVGEIVGTVGVEDVLDRIFASFCIGK